MNGTKMSPRKLIFTAAALALLVALGLVALPGRVGSYTRAFLGIVNTLRQIDGAKAQYAIDHKPQAGATASHEQLLPYLPERFWNPHADYRINAFGVDPEAVLHSRFDSLPAGTVIRLQTNAPGYLIFLPDKTHALDAGLRRG
jgi:hypothetical protein